MRRKITLWILRRRPAFISHLGLQILYITTAAAFRKKPALLRHRPQAEALREYADFTKACTEEILAGGGKNPTASCHGGDGSAAGVAGNVKVLGIGTTRKRLYFGALRLGRLVRRLSGLRDPKELRRLLIYLYEMIGIRLECGACENFCAAGDKTRNRCPSDGAGEEFCMTACYFSRVYSPAQCALMSFMDSGIIAGVLEERAQNEGSKLPNGSRLPGGGILRGRSVPPDGSILRFTERITEGAPMCRAYFKPGAHPRNHRKKRGSGQ